MSGEAQEDGPPAETTERPVTKRFRRASTANRPEPALVARQMQATTLAFAALGGMQAARRFMNEPHDALGGRPIDIAGADDDGLRRVTDAIRQVQGASAVDA